MANSNSIINKQLHINYGLSPATRIANATHMLMAGGK
jgi:hypothetical protein